LKHAYTDNKKFNAQTTAVIARLFRCCQLAVVCVALITPLTSHAAMADRSGGGASGAYKALVMEGLIVAASYATAEKPRPVGVATALVMPYAAAMDAESSPATRWLGTIIAEGIAYFNYRAGDDANNIDRDEVVRKNIIGWNIFAVAVGLSEKLTNNKVKQSAFSYQLLPTELGQTLQISYRF